MIFRPFLSLRYLNSAGINLNWARTNLGEKEKKISSQYDGDHLRASQYFGRVIIFRKDIIFVRENKLKSDSNFLLRLRESSNPCYMKLKLQVTKVTDVCTSDEYQ